MLSNHYGRRIGYGIGVFFVALIAGLFVLSFFLDGIIRPRIEKAMNEKLKGYHTTLPHAHLQILGGRLTLRGLKIIQENHPTPPVAQIDTMQFTIQWRELFTGHVVADVLLVRPGTHRYSAVSGGEDRTRFRYGKRDGRTRWKMFIHSRSTSSGSAMAT